MLAKPRVRVALFTAFALAALLALTGTASALTLPTPPRLQLPPLPKLPLLPGGGAGPTSVPGYGTNDYGGFRDILPPGTNGTDNGAQLLSFLTTGARPPHNDDQLGMYAGLVNAAPNVQASDISKYYKDSTFGVKPGDVEKAESPRPDVTIVRDKQFGVPHIYGTTRSGLMFGIGYATAEDRLFFIDVLRHVGRAQLTSFAGGAPGNRAFDAQQWAAAPYTEADLQRQIDSGVARLGPTGARIREDAQSYVDGINAYIRSAKLNPLLMPGEYAAIGRPAGPDPFKLTDIVATASLVGGIFGQGGGSELPWAQLLQSFQQRFGAVAGKADWRNFQSAGDPEAPTTVHGIHFPYRSIPSSPTPGSVAMPDPGSVVKPTLQTVGGGVLGLRARAAGAPVAQGLRGLLALPHSHSNALLVSARGSATGHPLAVFGPQVGYFAPQILMEEDIHGPGIDAAGAAFPGVNLYVELGHGRDYAWSATSAGQDIIDTFAVPLCDPGGGAASKSSDHYLFRGQCLAMETLQRVNHWTPNAADQTPPGTETLTVQRTQLGLVVGRATIAGKPVAYTSLRSTYKHELDSAVGFAKFNDPNAIRDARDFQHAAYDIGYTFNWFYADSKHIAYFNSGQNPVRATGTDPRLPVNSRFEWKGFDPVNNTATYTPFAQHPQVIDQQYLTSWNNKQAPSYNSADGAGYTSIFRSQLLDDRIQAGLRGGRKMTLAGLINAMGDAATADLRADKVLPYALQVLGTPSDPTVANAVNELRAWVADGAHRRRLGGSGGTYKHADAIRIMDAWWPQLVRSVYQPTMGAGLLGQLESNDTIDNDPHNGGDHLGSSWDVSFYGSVQKDLRQVLGLRVRGRYHRTYCGGGSLPACRSALAASLKTAAGVPAATVYPSDGKCQAGDPVCYDQIRFRALGGVTQPGIDWQNRPTFQQADEILGHRPFPGSPACQGRRLPRIGITRASASALTLAASGRAIPRDCGGPSARLVRVTVAVSRSAGHGRCRFMTRTGRLGRARSCHAPQSLLARGTARFSLLVRATKRHPLAPGGYRVQATVVDAAGNRATSRPRLVHVPAMPAGHRGASPRFTG